MTDESTLTNDNLSPRQVAAAIGVSESSLKRWCDRGLIAMVSTPGGHRRLTLAAVMEFVRTRNHELSKPEILGLPADVGRKRHSWDSSLLRFQQALLSGQEFEAWRIVIDTFLRGHTCAEIGDRLISPALHWLGEQWACGEMEVYRERRSCQICIAIAHELSRMLPAVPLTAPLAVGATPEADFYEVPTLFVRLALTEAGWQATSLGSSLPQSTLLAAISELRPQLFWISVSHAPDEATCQQQLAELAQHAGSVGCAVIGGGQRFPREVQAANLYHCDSLRGMLDLLPTLRTPADSIAGTL